VTRGRFHQLFTQSFYTCRSQKRKKYSPDVSFLALLGSACLKSARKRLVKLTPGVNPNLFLQKDYYIKNLDQIFYGRLSQF